MKRNRLIIGAIKPIAICVILFTLLFQVFSTIQVVLEYEYQYTDASNKLAGIEAQSEKGIQRIAEKFSFYIHRRQSALDVLALLLDADGQAVELEAMKPMIGLEALAILDKQYRVVAGDPIEEYDIDYAGLLERNQILFDGSDQRTELIAGDNESELLFASRLSNGKALAAEPSLCSPEGMVRLADILEIDSIYVFDREGKTVATNTVFSDFELAVRRAISPMHSGMWFAAMTRFACKPRDRMIPHGTGRCSMLASRAGTRRGWCKSAIVPDEYHKSLSLPLLSVIAEMPLLGDGTFYCMVDEDGLVRGWPDEAYNGGSAQRLGLTQTEMQDGYAGHQWLAEKQHFLTCRKIGEEYVFAVIPKRNVYGNDASVARFSLLVGLVMIGLMALLVLGKRAVFGKLFPGTRSRSAEHTGEGHSRISEACERFRAKDADDKLEELLRFFAGLSVVMVFLYYRWLDSRQEVDSMLSYVISLKWEHALNIFALTYVLWIVSMVNFVSKLLCWVIRWMMGIMSTRTRTIGTLLGNIIQYGAALGALFYCLPLIGFNPAAIVATASFISFALTFGAQELIKDFLSGMFIIFEDSLRVVDRVNIAGKEGYIEQIGLRMTTMVLEDGNAIR